MCTDEEFSLPCAAIIYGDGVNANVVLETFARDLIAQGRRVCGLIQRRVDLDGCCGDGIFLVDINEGGDFRVTQKLGTDASGCGIDPGALAEASRVLRAALDQPVDLLVVNKFGKVEAEGGGFVGEIAAAVAAGIPVVTTVHEKHLTRWRQFTGDLATQLPPNLTSLTRWWAGATTAAGGGMTHYH